MGKIYKKMDFSNLPKNQKTGHIDWKNSVGYKCDFVYGDIIGQIEIVDYFKDKSPIVYVKYKNRQKKMRIENLKQGNIGELIGVFTSDFYYDINQSIQAKNQKLIVVNRYYKKEDGKNRKYYSIQCETCKCISDIRENTLKQNKGCPVCASKKIVKGINDITTIAPWMIQYFPGGENEAAQYPIHSNKRIKFICPCCKKQRLTPISISQLYENHSCGCQCETIMSFPERVMYNILEQNNIQFIHCATKNNVLPWAKKYRYDFYLIDYNVIIETHGAQHYCEHGFSKIGGKTLLEEQNNDVLKKTLALGNGISSYFEIDCRESDIDFILNSCKKSGLLNYLNIHLDQINQNNLIENIFFKYIDCTKNILLDNQNITPSELSDILNISVYMAKKVLIYSTCGLYSNTSKGNKNKSSKTNPKPIYMYKDGQYLASFKSFYDLYTNSQTVLGIEIKTHDSKKYVDTGRKYLKHYTFYTYECGNEVVA